MKRAGIGLVASVALVAVFAPYLAPNAPDQRFANLLYAPPTRVYVWQGGVHAPYIYEWRVVSRLERSFRKLSNRFLAKPFPFRFPSGSRRKNDSVWPSTHRRTGCDPTCVDEHFTAVTGTPPIAILVD